MTLQDYITELRRGIEICPEPKCIICLVNRSVAHRLEEIVGNSDDIP